MGLAIVSSEKLYHECLAHVLWNSLAIRPVGCSSVRECLGNLPKNEAHLVIVDLDSTGETDLQFLLGAISCGGLSALAITSTSDGELPEDLEHRIDRSASVEDLIGLTADLLLRLGTPSRRRRSRGAPNGLSDREYQVARLVARGYSNRKIAQDLVLREQTVKNMVSSINRRLGCDNRVQLALRMRDSDPNLED